MGLSNQLVNQSSGLLHYPWINQISTHNLAPQPILGISPIFALWQKAKTRSNQKHLNVGKWIPDLSAIIPFHPFPHGTLSRECREKRKADRLFSSLSTSGFPSIPHLSTIPTILCGMGNRNYTSFPAIPSPDSPI